jgi:hypothetical protein
MAWPQVWIEDDAYLTGVFALSRGLLPYRDFPLPHLPLLETVAALALRLPFPTLRTAELLTQVSAAGASVMVFLIGRRLAGGRTGLVASAIFSVSPLLFRYHLFEREVFVVVPELAAIAVAIGERWQPSERTQGFTIGALIAVGMCVKLTAVSALIGIAAYLYFAGRPKAASFAVASATVLVLAVSGVLLAAFGTDFAVQVVLFRLLHATFPSLGVKLTEMRLTLDIALATGAAGVVLLLWSGKRGMWSAVLWQLASGVVVLVLLNATYWAHTGLELLPWLALCGGYLLANLARGARPLVCAAIAAALVAAVTPIDNLNWEAGDGSPLGFGYRDRAEIESAARFIAEHAGPDQRVVTPPVIAVAARRLELVPYLEIAGDVRDITAAVRREGYWSALHDSTLARGTFWESVEASARITAPQLLDGLRRRTAAALVNDSPDDLMPVQLIDVAADDLRSAGYSLESVTPHYEIWIPR